MVSRCAALKTIIIPVGCFANVTDRFGVDWAFQNVSQSQYSACETSFIIQARTSFRIQHPKIDATKLDTCTMLIYRKERDMYVADYKMQTRSCESCVCNNRTREVSDE